MAVLGGCEEGWVISHDLCIRNIYKSTKHCDERKSYELNPALFDIQVPFVRNKCAQRYSEVGPSGDAKFVKRAHEILYESFASSKYFSDPTMKNNQTAKSLASDFYNKLTRHPHSKFHGGNNSEEAQMIEIGNEHYLIPEKSLFYCNDVADISKYLEGKRFDLILMDPPWWNKFIRRKRKKNHKLGYDMVYDKDLSNIPVESLLDENGILGIWCTNAPSHINAILKELFAAWNIEFFTQWFWLKVTKSGQPVCAFSQLLGKQPFERIIFGIKKTCNKNSVNLDKDKIIMSIPSAIHSHKPPLHELLKPYLPEEPRCLEVFARYLLPSWTSYGIEVLKLQHISLYCQY